MLVAAALMAVSTIAPNCAQAARLRSVDGEEAVPPVRHAFQNGLARPLRLVWLDRAGKRVDLGPLAPGGFTALQTYPGHVFLLVDAGGRCRAAVRIDGVLSGSYVGTSRYVRQPVGGWTVFADRALDPARDPARTALATIARMLREAEVALPPAALAQVRSTPIFLHAHSGGGGMYHFDPAWLVAHGRTVELVDAIEISDASVFIDTARHQPGAVLHELAHSYYAKLSDAGRAEVDRVFRVAMAAGLYRSVRREDGTTGPAYASASAVEYFAEISEAYFGRNDFQPFTRDELAAYDPAGLALLRRLWR